MTISFGLCGGGDFAGSRVAQISDSDEQNIHLPPEDDVMKVSKDGKNSVEVEGVLESYSSVDFQFSRFPMKRVVELPRELT
jgi:hypothetical protein